MAYINITISACVDQYYFFPKDRNKIENGVYGRYTNTITHTNYNKALYTDVHLYFQYIYQFYLLFPMPQCSMERTSH